ncbi:MULTISPECIES: hypothetical protein [Sphingomonas]|jgi:hypothetical protein|uniref:Uncharacterized protein n=1 Tax=Sphingomonas taxi TaxID=1549858 RepID=A0A097EFJ9_9SPHN|nr:MULTISPECIES: hypothetical protein [Sphingomonas]AIT06345.1 hypothetical protein MC45_08075 [Sphingomonas taxi]
MTGLIQNAPSAIAGVEPALAHALADEMAGLTTVLADLAYDLAANSETLRQHMHSLQAIDRITQAQLAMADVLRSSASAEERVAAVTLEELGVRLLASLRRYRERGVPGEFDIA